MIILQSIEDTLIYSYEEMLPELREPFKTHIRENLNDERYHSREMKILLEEAKKAVKTRSHQYQDIEIKK